MVGRSRGWPAGILTCLWLLAPLPSAAAQRRPIPAYRVRQVREAVDSSYRGRVGESVWHTRVGSVIERLRQASGAERHELTWRIDPDSAANASAWPGGLILVNAGMLSMIDSIVATEHLPQAAAGSRASEFLAAVLGHEIAHLVLGHVERSLAQRLDPAQDTLSTLPADVMERLGPRHLAEFRIQREFETAADSLGAVIMLRAGWQIQSAIDLWGYFDRADRDPGGRVARLSFIASHPMASMRGANLEILRGQLKKLQTNLDDAVALIDANVDLPLAIRLLGEVLLVFPDLVSARLAVAVAHHRLWTNTMTAEQLRWRPLLTAGTELFADRIRGESELAHRDQARTGYRTILASIDHPAAVLDLAVLEAQDGQTDSAHALLRRAERNGLSSVRSLNDAAVIQALLGDTAGARTRLDEAFSRSASEPDARILFNTAKILTLAGDGRGPELFARYFEIDSRSPWAVEAERLIGRGPAHVRDLGPSPTIAGLRLGMTERQARAILGAGAEISTEAAGRFLDYGDLGIGLLFTKARLVLVSVFRPFHEAIRDVRLGLPLRSARAILGPPHATTEDTWSYLANGWTLTIRHDGRSTESIVVGRPGSAP